MEVLQKHLMVECVSCFHPDDTIVTTSQFASMPETARVETKVKKLTVLHSFGESRGFAGLGKWNAAVDSSGIHIEAHAAPKAGIPRKLSRPCKERALKESSTGLLR